MTTASEWFAPLPQPEVTALPPPCTALFSVQGMRCAGCVRTVEASLRQLPGVSHAVVNLVTQTAFVAYQADLTTPAQIADHLTQAGFASTPQTSNQQERLAALTKRQQQERWQNRSQLAWAGLLILLSSLGHLEQMGGIGIPALRNISWHFALATIALLGPGRPILSEGWQGIWRGRPNMNTLVGLGTVTAYLASVVALAFPQLGWECFFNEPVMILGFILLGRTLERQARGRASAALHQLLSLQPATVHWLPHANSANGTNPRESHPEQRLEIPVEMVQVGAKLQVFAGEKFPVDGEICQGQTLVDESMLTGEAMPVQKNLGAEVIGGTLNQTSPVVMVATRTGNDTALSQIIQLVESSQTRKAPIQQFADWVAGYFTYGVMSLALLTFVFWWLWGSHWFAAALGQLSPMMVDMPGQGLGHLHNTIRGNGTEVNPILVSLKFAIAVLVVACPCALGLATPTAILVGTSVGAEQGLLIRGGDVLERVHTLDTIVFDKTGTLTTGVATLHTTWLSEVSLDEAPPTNFTLSQLLQLAASLEQGVKHPLALGIVAAAAQANLALLTVENLQVISGAGVRGHIAGQEVLVGSATWLEQRGISIPAAETAKAELLGQQGMSLVYLVLAGQLLGGLALSDRLRPEAVTVIRQLQQLGLRVQVLTGDQPQVAAATLAPLGITPDQILAQLRPQDKAAVIEHLQSQGHRVGMVGDGINDAPALAQADVGIALASGTDVAMETAQIVLMRSCLTGKIQLTDVVTALRLGRRTFQKIQQNLIWASGYNLIALPMAMGVFVPLWGISLDPSMAGAMMAVSSVLVVCNSLLLRQMRMPASSHSS